MTSTDPPGGEDGGTAPGTPGGVPIERLLAQVPPPVARLARGTRWTMAGSAPTGTTSWRIEHPDGTALLLKVAPGGGAGAAQLRAEEERLIWLAGQLGGPCGALRGLAVPAVLASASEPASDEHYLALTVPRGAPADGSELAVDADSLVVALAEGLRAFHELPVAPCPFAMGVDEHLALASARLDQDLVDRRRFDPIHARHTPAQLFEHLVTMRSPGLDGDDDLVVAHGAPTLDNTLVADGRVTAYVNLERAGVSDRYRDLAIAARQVANRVSPHALGPFFSAYGIDAPDLRRFDFYQLLDELCR